MTESQIEDLVQQQADLKRSLSRLSFVGMGLSNDLDEKLKQLRDLIKSDTDALTIKQNIDEVSKILLTVEDKKTSAKIEVAGIEQGFDTLLDDSRLPSPLKLELRKAQGQKQEETAVRIARSMMDIILDYVAHAKNQQVNSNTPSQKGFFAKLFDRKTNEESNDSAEEDSIVAKVSEDLKTSLQLLVDQLSAMENYSEIALALTEKVAELNSTDQLVGILELITNAFVEISSHEHQQLESFLKSLNKRIDRVNGFVSETIAYSHQISNDSKALDQRLQGSVSEIKDSVENSEGLQEVKTLLYQKMDAIIDAVGDFRSQQDARHQKLASDIENLQEQLSATEDESLRLRDELAAQRVRAQTDPLTHLPNRYSYNERLTQEYNRWRRYRSPLSLVICDIDLFKNINDEFGHDAGDEVLKSVANFLQAALRESDFVARFGGEEFVILLPETPLIDATKAMNKVRQGVKEIHLNYQEKNIHTAMSFGISEFENNDTPKAVFKRADQALYRAKEKGRDQVCCQRAKPTKN